MDKAEISSLMPPFIAISTTLSMGIQCAEISSPKSNEVSPSVKSDAKRKCLWYLTVESGVDDQR